MLARKAGNDRLNAVDHGTCKCAEMEKLFVQFTTELCEHDQLLLSF